jgi:hypothetical protein
VDSDVDYSGNESNESTDDGFFSLEKTNCNCNIAEEEFNYFESFKRNSSNVDNSGNESNESIDDDFFSRKDQLCNCNIAEEEFNYFESFKRNRYHPKWVREKLEIQDSLWFGANW